MTKAEWDKVSTRLRAIFNLGIEQAKWLQENRLVRLIASIPFIAGCDKAEETSFSHLAVYYMSTSDSSKDIYFHKPEDDSDIYARLMPINNFKAGNPKIIQCCMDLIALNMISNYKNDAEEDRAIGKYNPINEAGWDYDALSQKLIQNINKNATSEITDIYTIQDALTGFWQV